MAITHRNYLVAGLLGLIAASAAALPRAAAPPRAAAAAPPGAAVAGPRAAAAAGVTAYWTRARMARARPLGALLPDSRGRPWQYGGEVARATGKEFFTLNGAAYVCSGSTVDSANSDVVVTAAHCVCDGTGARAAHWIFVPGYAGGAAPYGSYTARRFFVASGWDGGMNEDDDVAFVTLNTALVHGYRVHAGEEAGAQAIAFGAVPVRAYVFGYPAEPPYGGQQIDYCSGPVAERGTDPGLRCAMTAGDSGGPWLSGFSPRTGSGTIVAVSAFKYSDDIGTLYGADLGRAAKAAYERAQHA